MMTKKNATNEQLKQDVKQITKQDLKAENADLKRHGVDKDAGVGIGLHAVSSFGLVGDKGKNKPIYEPHLINRSGRHVKATLGKYHTDAESILKEVQKQSQADQQKSQQNDLEK